MATFLDDRPIRSLANDLLWLSEVNIREQIENIGHTIAAPLMQDAQSSESLTFAIHGPWGMGKSSAMQLIRSAAMEKAGEAAHRFHFIEYSAPAHEAMRGSAEEEESKVARSVPVTLALRIVQSLAGKTEKEQANFLMKYLGSAFAEVVERTDEDDFARAPKVFQQFTANLVSVIDFDKIISNLMAPNASSGANESKVIVVLIDDLDRCQPAFVWDVLNTIQQWSGIQNLFVILALDRDHLRRAIESRPGVEQVTADYALEKYIQHSITVPSMNQERLRTYISALNSGNLEIGSVLSALGDNADLLHYGLTLQSPRSVKRCINTLSLVVAKNLSQATAAGESKTRRFLKELVLQYTWSDFFEKFYLLAMEIHAAQGTHPIYHAFRSLEQICLDYASDSDEARLRFELERLSKQMDVPWSNLPRALARYLGVRPLFFSDDSSKEAVQAEALVNGRKSIFDNIRHQTFDDQTLRQVFFDIEAAAMAKDEARAIALGRNAISYVTDNYNSLQPRAHDTASVLGDIASIVAAETQDVALAVELFQLASDFKALPRVEANNLQRFSALILGKEIVALYGIAEEMIGKLRAPPLDKIKPEHTETLAGGLALALGSPGEAAPIVVEEVDITDRSRFATAMVFLQSENRPDALIALARRRYEYVSDPSDAYNAIRLLADGLVVQAREFKDLAMDIYRVILEHYLDVSEDAKEDRVAVQHNFAILCYAEDYDEEAGKLWFLAYRERSTDKQIQRTYSLYLSRAKRPDLAAAVARGAYIDEEILIPGKALPSRFSQDFPQWIIEKPWISVS